MRILALVSLCALLVSPAYAGRNANGMLIVHTNDANGYTSNICNRFDTVDSPGTCEGAGTQTNKGEDVPALIWLIAAFCPWSSPGVSVIYFGLDHNLPPGLGYFENYGLCGPAGSIEVPDAGWPDQGGNSVAFGSPIIGDIFFPFYYLNAYGFEGAFVGTGINPTGGYAAFVDDSSPPIQDYVLDFGRVRWGVHGANDCLGCGGGYPGACCYPDGTCIVEPSDQCTGVFQGDFTICDPNPCPQLTGACCFADGSCEYLTADACTEAGGAYQGDGVDCSVCTGLPGVGACCFDDGTCQELVAEECGSEGGTYQGDDTTCDQATCPPVATESTTWGRIKADFR